jgi:hypothetical protein
MSFRQQIIAMILALLVIVPVGVIAVHSPGSRVSIIKIPPVYPGKLVGSAISSWIRPYVRQDEITINDTTTKTITVYAENGSVLYKFAGSHITVEGDYVIENRRDTIIGHSLYDTSLFVYSADSRYQGNIFVRNDGENRYVDYSADGRSYTDYYMKGNYVATYGPHNRKPGDWFAISDSGSIAYTLADSGAIEGYRVVMTNPQHEEIFTFPGTGSIVDIIPSLSGDCIIVHYSISGPGADPEASDYACIFKSGKTIRARFGMDIGMVTWIPNSKDMIVQVPDGDDYEWIGPLAN